MRLFEALQESRSIYGISAIEYEDKIYYYDPYGFVDMGYPIGFTEFRSGIGTFNETLLWQHPDFSPENERNDGVEYPEFRDVCDEFQLSTKKRLYNMHLSSGFKPLNKENARAYHRRIVEIKERFQ